MVEYLHAQWKPRNEIMNISIFVEPSGIDLTMKDHTVPAAVEIQFTQLSALSFWFLFDFGQTVFDAGHDTNVKRIKPTIRSRCHERLCFPPIFPNVELYWGGF